ncbi:MAG: hypothetical protein H7A23_10065 [Leptospiraceae bacterium]|nr:hypothetical protein [Leptospiraceae bacterium]
MHREIEDIFGRKVRFTDERKKHLEEDHPEMKDSEDLIINTLQEPEEVKFSRSDKTVELFYKFFQTSIVGAKYLCVAVKNLITDYFIITAYYTDKKKKGDSKWIKVEK